MRYLVIERGKFLEDVDCPVIREFAAPSHRLDRFQTNGVGY